MGERRGIYSVLVGRCKGKRQLGRNSNRWEDYVKICLQKTEWEGVCDDYGERGGVYTTFWWGDVRERDNLEEIAIDGRIILKFVFKK